MANQQYVRQYNSFRGVDFTSDPVDVADYRLQYAVNMWRDYENNKGGMIETIPGFREIPKNEMPRYAGELHTAPKSNGMHHYRTTNSKGNIIDYLIVHEGTVLFYKQIESDEFNVMYSGDLEYFMANNESHSVIANNKLFIVDGKNIISIEPSVTTDENGEEKDILIAKTFDIVTFNITSGSGHNEEAQSKELTKYVPTVASDGKMYEAPNLLTTLAYEKFNNVTAPEIDEENNNCAKFNLIAITTIVRVMLGEKQIPQRKENVGYVFSEKSGLLEIYGYNEDDYLNKQLVVLGSASEFRFSEANKYPTFHNSNPSIVAKDAILGCTSICVYDGKIFLTGNQKHPNLVFFTSTAKDLGANDPTYIGAYNWLNTGIGMSPNKAMITSQGTLMVFKGNTVQDGSIYYLTPFDVNTGEKEFDDMLPRFYLPTEGAAGIGCIGGAINFMDDAVFISKRGLDAVGKQLTNLERSIVHRSTMVDRKLLAEDLSSAEMVEWKGYLVISVNGHMYLADSRAMYTDETGNAQYEWFYLEGIGTYLQAYRNKQYRYLSGSKPEGEAFDQYAIKPDNNEEIVEVTVTKDDNDVYYTNDENKYLCYLDDEYTVKQDAKFYPAKNLVVINDVLFFSADNGAVYCFNTDKRGEIPESIMTIEEEKEVWHDNNYDSKEDFVGWIPQEYYSFDGLRYPSGIITKTDNAGAPYATKNTINRSLVLRVGADPRTHSTVTVEVLTDRNPTFRIVDRKDTSEQTFGFQDFSASTFDTYPFAFLTYREHERKWIEKKYKIYNDAFRGILRLHSLSYRYEIGGNIK